MRDRTIAAHYADVLVALAQREEDLHGWGTMIGDLAAAVAQDERLRRFLESPRVGDATKIEVVRRALGALLPPLFVRYLETLVHHRRQRLIESIAVEYTRLLDQLEGRVHVDVTVARPLSDRERAALARLLTQAVGSGRTVVPVVRSFPPILGGVIVRMGDYVADGSVRTRLARLRRQLVSAR